MKKNDNLSIKGLKKASGETFDCYGRGHTQINYDMETGQIYTDFHVGQTYSVYKGNTVIYVCDTDRHMTMREIKQAIELAVTKRRLSETY